MAKENAFPRSDDVYQSTDLLKEFYGTIRHLLTNFEGSLVQETESQFLVSFVSVSKAVNAALEIRTKFHAFPSDTISCKIGLSAGVPVTEKKSIFEDTINLAKRICTIIPGEIIISAGVAHLSGSENLSTFSEADNIVILTPDDEIFITRFMDFIDSTWEDSDLKVDDFSMPAGLSKSQLYRKLKILTGKSPNIFLKDYRLKKALELLDKNISNVSEIAFETGFSSPSYFSKCYQKKYGHTPSAYFLPPLVFFPNGFL